MALYWPWFSLGALVTAMGDMLRALAMAPYVVTLTAIS